MSETTSNLNTSPGSDTRLPEASKLPSTVADAAHELEALPIHGFQGTHDEIERQWYEQVYRGRGDRMLQLT